MSDALNRRLDERPRVIAEAQAAREQARQRLQRLIEAIENGVAPQSVASAIAERETDVARAEAILADVAEPLIVAAALPGAIRLRR